MTENAKRVIKWGAIGNIVALCAFLMTQGVIVAPWNIVSKAEMVEHQETVEKRLDKMSHNIALIMGALGVKDHRHD